MNAEERATFDELPRAEALALLERNHLGRMAFTLHDRVDIEPISYVSRDGWIYARTSSGTKVSTVRHHPWVAFQVDEIHGRFDWQSVVVRGAIYFVAPTGSHVEHEAYEAALDAIRSVDPDALTDRDLAPHRTHMLRIHIDEITGRLARSSNG